MMQITFLGTGTSQGIPVIGCECNVCKSTALENKRLRSSVLISLNAFNILIDSGPDFRAQMLAENITRLHAILLTHAHKDHIGGLDDVRAFNHLMQKPMDIYAKNDVISALKREYPYAFETCKYPGAPEFKVHEIENQIFDVENIKVTPIEVMHWNLKILGFRIYDFAYITDANAIADKEKEKIKGLEVLVINALRKEKHISHFNLEEALDLIKELKPQKAYLTHIGHQMGEHDVIQKLLPKNVFIAYDGLKIDIL